MISFDSCMLFSGWWQSATHVIFSTWFVAVTVMYRKKKKEKTHPKETKPLTPAQQTAKQSPLLQELVKTEANNAII